MKSFEPATAHEHAHDEADHEDPRGRRLARKVSRKANEHQAAGGAGVSTQHGVFGDAVNAGIHQTIARASTSSGHALPSTLQRKFESSLGADLSSVRVHTGEASATAASAVSARAYATGQDIHFGAGQYDPSSPTGEHLLAHEVAHTVQQRGASSAPQFKLEISDEHDPSEHDADRAADAMIQGKSYAVSASSGVARKIYRQAHTHAQAPAAAAAPSREDQLELAQMSHQMITMRQTAETRLDTNVNSWDAWVLQQIPSAVNHRITGSEEMLAWIDWAQMMVGPIVDVAMLATSAPMTKAAAIAVKAMAAAARMVSREGVTQDFASARSTLARGAQQQFRQDQDDARASGRNMIAEFLQAHPLIGGATEDNNGAQEQLYAQVNQRYPQMTVSCLPQINQMVDRVFVEIEAHERERAQQRSRTRQVERVAALMGIHNGQLRDRDGGLPSEEDAHRANAQARQETSYTGPDIPLSEVYNGVR